MVFLVYNICRSCLGMNCIWQFKINLQDKYQIYCCCLELQIHLLPEPFHIHPPTQPSTTFNQLRTIAKLKQLYQVWSYEGSTFDNNFTNNKKILVLRKLTSDQYSSICLYLSKTPSIFSVKTFLGDAYFCSFELRYQNCLLCQKDLKGHTCQKGQEGSKGPNDHEAL